MRLKALGEAYRRRLDFIVEVPWGDQWQRRHIYPTCDSLAAGLLVPKIDSTGKEQMLMVVLGARRWLSDPKQTGNKEEKEGTLCRK